MAGPKGETVSAKGGRQGRGWGLLARSTPNPGIRPLEGPLMGSELGWEESPLRALFAGSCWLQGDGGDHRRSRAAGECPLALPRVWVGGWHCAPPLSPIIPPCRAGKAPEDLQGSRARRESW